MLSNKTLPILLLRAEAVVVLGAALLLYGEVGWSWWLFAWLILLPDIALLGYLAGTRAGALTYNAVHTYLAPAVVAVGAYLGESRTGMAVALIWIAHIAVDRLLGMGLKYPKGFGVTHLGG